MVAPFLAARRALYEDVGRHRRDDQKEDEQQQKLGKRLQLRIESIGTHVVFFQASELLVGTHMAAAANPNLHRAKLISNAPKLFFGGACDGA